MNIHANRLFRPTGALTIAAALLTLSAPSARAEEDCAKIGATVQSSILAEPDRVLVIVEDAILAHEICSSEIVTAAITATDREPEMAKQIVYTAVSAAPGMAGTIGESAVAAAPGAAEGIASALRSAINGNGGPVTAVRSGPATTVVTPAAEGGAGGKAPVVTVGGGKAPIIGGKTPGRYAPTENLTYTEDFGKTPVDIRGIYLIPPAAGGLAVIEVIRDPIDVSDEQPVKPDPDPVVPPKPPINPGSTAPVMVTTPGTSAPVTSVGTTQVTRPPTTAATTTAAPTTTAVPVSPSYGTTVASPYTH